MLQFNKMKHFYIFLFFFLLSIGVFGQQKPPSLTPSHEKGLTFFQNKNQWDSSVKYRADLPGGFLFIKNNSLQYSFYDQEAVGRHHVNSNPRQNRNVSPSQAPQTIKAHSFEVFFENSNKTQPEGKEIKSIRQSYLLGNNPDNWAGEVPAFGELSYPNLYNGIDLNFYEHRGHLKYEFIVSTTANPSEIKMHYQNAQNISLDEHGNLVIQTTINEVTELKPFCYQNIAGRVKVVEAYFHLENETLSFHFPKGYNKNYELIIDPELIFSTYSGSNSDNWGFSATFDDAGSVYAAGIAFGAGFPTTSGAFEVTFAGQIDVSIHKYNATGTDLIYGTYIGGNEVEIPHSTVVTPTGELIILGTTASTNFPTSASAFDNTLNNPVLATDISPLGGITYTGGSDLFVCKLTPFGSNIVASTYLGGSGNDGLNYTETPLTTIRNYGDQFRGDVILDNSGNIYVTSTTQSNDFPTNNAFQNTLSGQQDAVLVKFPSDLSGLTWSTYLGGNAFEAGFAIKLASNQDVYICGATTSTNLPNTTGAFQSNALGSDDGFVARIDNNGNLLRTTYLGTSQADQAFLLDLDESDNVHIIGQSLGNYPVSSGVYSNAGSHQFIQKLDKTLSTNSFSTVIGSGRPMPDITFTAFLVNECGNIYLSGWGGQINSNNGLVSGSSTLNLPITADAYRDSTQGSDFYIMILEKDAKSLLYGTYFGSTDDTRGDHVDGGTCRFSKDGIIYHIACACSPTGTSGSTDFPTTSEVWSSTNNSINCNMAAFKFDIEALEPNFQILDAESLITINRGCLPADILLQYTGSPVRSVQWELEGVGIIGTGDSLSYTFTTGGIKEIKVTINNPASCIQNASLTKTLEIFENSLTVLEEIPICPDEVTQLSASLTVDNTATYQWTPTTNLDNPNIANPTVSNLEETTDYIVQVTDANGCEFQDTTTVRLIEEIIPDFSVPLRANCGEPLKVFFENNTVADTFIWEMGDGTIFTEKIPEPYLYDGFGTFTITLRSLIEDCEVISTVEVNVQDNTVPIANVITPNGDGLNDKFVLENREGYTLEIRNRWGSLVYESDNYQDDWGGDVPAGTYFYYVKAPSGIEIECNGWLQVIK